MENICKECIATNQYFDRVSVFTDDLSGIT